MSRPLAWLGSLARMTAFSLMRRLVGPFHEDLLRVGLTNSTCLSRMAGIGKGFRMPASHCAKGCTEAGVRKASKEETAGGVCAGGSVGLWGFKARSCATWPLSDGTAGLNGYRGR